MALTRDIRIKVTSVQFELIKNKAQINGYKTVSSFIRESLLKEEETEILLRKIYELINKKKF